MIRTSVYVAFQSFAPQTCAPPTQNDNSVRCDIVLQEIRELILALMGKKINIPKYFKVSALFHVLLACGLTQVQPFCYFR
jgi:hypothetical protein